MGGKRLGILLLAVVPMAVAPAGAHTQEALPREVLHYADTVLLNGKILTMDREDDRFTRAEALAIRDGRILAVGSDAAILSLAGLPTQRIDLRGRTVIPGIIDTHAHLQEYGPNHWGRDLAGLGSTPIRGETWAEVKAQALATVERLAGEMPPSQWIKISLPSRALDDAGRTVDARVAVVQGVITRSDLDAVAPDHPVLIQGVTRSVFNSRALEIMMDFYGALDEEIVPETGVAESVAIRRALGTDIFVGDARVLSELFRKEMLEWASYGVTTWSSSLSALLDLQGFAELDRRGAMPIRLAYTHAQGITSSAHGPESYRHLGDLRNIGTPYLWNIGSSVVSGDGSYPQIASTAPAAPEVKQRELSRLMPGEYRRRTLEAMVASGQRIAGLHIAGDATLDHFLDVIEEQSTALGMTIEEVHAMRHASDHCTFNPRSDQLARLRAWGIIMSCAPKYIDATARNVAEDYGAEYTAWVVPVRSLIEAGVRTVYESDVHDLDRKGMLYYLEALVTRADEQGNPWNPEERVDRVTALLMATRWAAEYVLREQELGSLEPGKWADLVVLDGDYLTVPEDEISQIRAVTTMVGGKIVYEAASD